jgi:hypothetical protein
MSACDAFTAVAPITDGSGRFAPDVSPAGSKVRSERFLSYVVIDPSPPIPRLSSRPGDDRFEE